MPVSAHKGGGIIESRRNVRINLSSHLFLLKRAQSLLCVSVLSPCCAFALLCVGVQYLPSESLITITSQLTARDVQSGSKALKAVIPPLNI